MDAILTYQTGENLEVYADDVIIKTEDEHNHAYSLEDIL